MANQPPQIQSAGFLVVRDQPSPSFLLMKHADRWDLPKGHLDGDESRMEAAMRELREETGIESSQIEIDPNFQYVDIYTVQARDGSGLKPKQLTIYLARLKDDVPIQPTEHIGYQWFDWNPPHRIQERTIDPLLAQLESYWSNDRTGESPASG